MKHKRVLCYFAAALLLACIMLSAPQAPAQTILFDKTDLVVNPGDIFTLQISGETGIFDIIGFSLYLRMIDGSQPSPLTIIGATLGSEWAYAGGSPTLPQLIPDSGNSQDYGNALANATLPSGVYSLTTLTIRVSNSATPSITPVILQSTGSTVFLDSSFNEYAPSSASLSIVIVPEPATTVLFALGGFILVARRWRKGFSR